MLGRFWNGDRWDVVAALSDCREIVGIDESETRLRDTRCNKLKHLNILHGVRTTSLLLSGDPVAHLKASVHTRLTLPK